MFPFPIPLYSCCCCCHSSRPAVDAMNYSEDGSGGGMMSTVVVTMTLTVDHDDNNDTGVVVADICWKNKTSPRSAPTSVTQGTIPTSLSRHELDRHT
jgi:hypothetical protein